jgi:hypothetical protein
MSASGSNSHSAFREPPSIRVEVGATPPPINAEVSERAKRRSALTTEGLGFKSLSPAGSPFVSPYNSDEESEVVKRQRRSARRNFTKKRFKDQVYDHIELPGACIAIMDTPQFQRLRCLKQLGAAYFVFPGASHNRFEHCIGVAHLAGKMAKHFRESQPELDITEKVCRLGCVRGADAARRT